MDTGTLILFIQLIGVTTLIFWLDTFAQSLLPLGIHVSNKKGSSWLGVVFVFLYPLFLGLSYWVANKNHLMKETNTAVFWSIIPIIIFTVIFFIVKHNASHFQKTIKYVKRPNTTEL